MATADTGWLERDPRLAAIVRRLVAAYQPERIYLFGSVARGDAGPDSDYGHRAAWRHRAMTARRGPVEA